MFRVEGPNTQYLGTWVLGNNSNYVSVLGKNMTIRYLDP